MGELRVRRLRALVAALVAVAVLSGCSPFEADPGVMRELDEEVASWDLTSAGEVIAECSDSVSLGARYSYTLVLRGDDAWEDVRQRFAEAGFESAFSRDVDYDRVDLARGDPTRDWRAAVNLQEESTEGGYCGDDFMIFRGDVVVSLGATIEE